MNDHFSHKTDCAKNNNPSASDLFAAHLKQQLDTDQMQLSPSIASKLRNARAEALLQAQPHKTALAKIFSWFKLPVQQHPWLASCASLLAVVAAVSYIQLNPSIDDSLVLLDAESDILFADESLELYEDLEFYHWLADTGY